jgi:uncharacterized membrane protein
MRIFRILLREQKKRRRTFYCPVCHLPLSLDDLDNRGYTVCPVCSVVLEVVMSGGFPLPVVHDLEIKRAQPRLRIHSMSTHVSVGLLPLGLFFGALSLVMSFFSLDYAGDVERLGLILFSLSLAGSLLTFGTGFLDWWTRYRHRHYKQIYDKIKLSILLWVIGFAAVAIRLKFVDGGDILTPAFLAFLGLQAVMLLIIGVMGHIGGNLVFGK